ncbi:carotenoid oxygenase family protein [Lyngbya confervoides]|uniref:Carotenoid oxygenase family protein n=1 Tax=Lyngbya confervoides BDU141951 TaxID=1574623 RepID=A0ABD4T7X7_9CYAN|nr:carotenoid oxygenase family protein [Lyngbya confervoides]MCM1984656.1 carotenoid oxygenase family protein [Lyngbya confervoides BDU141951]
MTATSPQPKTTSSQTSYCVSEWQGGHRSLKEEYSYWIDDIEGQIPGDLRGTVFRNGPGLLDVNGDRLHHPFDGDGMICAFSFHQGKAHFQNRFVRTEGYLAEQKAGRILYRGVFGTQKPGGWFANMFDLRFKNIANTNIVYWGNKLLALWEAGMPHRLNPATLETEGLDNLGGVLGDGQPFSAHPRFDPGDAQHPPRFVNFSVESGLSTKLTVFEFDLGGQLIQQYSHSIPGLGFFHDFVLTPNFTLFFQNPVVMNPIPFVLGLRGAAQSLQFLPDQPTTIWIIPRNGKDPVQRIDTEACFVFHHANAFEQDHKILVDSVCYSHFPTLGPEEDYRNVNFDQYPAGQLYRFTLDLNQQQVYRDQLASRSCEFPALHPRSMGQDYRYLYLGVTHEATGNAPLQAIQKLDLRADSQSTDPAQIWSAAPSGFIGEPLFIPKAQTTQEDAGWVLTLIYDGAANRSELVILDGEDLSRGAIARLKLKHHIPYGLHGCYTPETFI